MQSAAKFDELQTLSFEPSDDYMRQSMSTPKVQQYLARHHLRKRIFIITGVKIAFGAKVKDEESSLGNANISLGLDGTAVGVAVGVGPHAEGTRGYSQSMSFERAEPFVFAYRLREIRYRRGVASDKPYRDGALYGAGGTKDKDATATGDEEPAETAIFMSVDEEDITGGDVDLESACVLEHEAAGIAENQADLSDEEDEICELILLS
ncbi:hypothetical protein FALBO_4941 [Fusarium albosuccineum]|uniref:Uncharacterized protein n=1 Tax=Fusarium albosuccineum TaxID=1237068 RepID=A0A8H4LEH9_9HYPO|nr:hypothetical protein FALBO_4941 [Fusarium albosuccineum]